MDKPYEAAAEVDVGEVLAVAVAAAAAVPVVLLVVLRASTVLYRPGKSSVSAYPELETKVLLAQAFARSRTLQPMKPPLRR